MSRIHKALKKAREKRQEHKRLAGKVSPLEKIVYTSSKVVPVSNNLLEKTWWYRDHPTTRDPSSSEHCAQPF